MKTEVQTFTLVFLTTVWNEGITGVMDLHVLKSMHFVLKFMGEEQLINFESNKYYLTG